MKPVDPRLLRFASAARGFLVLQVLIGLLQVTVVLAFSWLLAGVLAATATEVFGAPLTDFDLPAPFDPSDPGGAGWSTTAVLAALAALALLRAGLTWSSEVVAARAAAKVKSQLRAQGAAAIVAAAQAGRDEAVTAAGGPAQVMTMLGSGLDALDAYFSRFLPQLVLTVLAVPAHLVVLALADITTAVIVAVTMPLIPVFMVLIGWATQAAQRRQRNRLNRLARAYLDVVEGLSTLKVFNRQHHQRQNLTAISEAHRRSTMKVLRISFLSGFVLELAASLSVALVAVSIGLRLIDGTLGLFIGLFVLLIVPEAYAPLRHVGAAYHSAADGTAAAEELLDLLEAAGPAAAGASAAADRRQSGSAAPAGPGLRVCGLGAVRGESQVFSGVDWEAAAGEITVLTGPSGVGKSTMFAAMLGLVPHTGEVLLREAHRASDVPLTRAQIAHSGQRHGLRAGTVAENIALGDASPDHGLAADLLEELQLNSALVPEALVREDAGPKIAGPEVAGRDLRAQAALGKVLGVGGSGLSGGQAHRVAVARAIYRARRRDLPVLLLDEPSAALDAQAEQRLLQVLRGEADAGRCVVVISHRPAVVAAADRQVTLGPRAAEPRGRSQEVAHGC